MVVSWAMFAYILYLMPLPVKYKKAMGLNKFPTEFQNHIFSGLLTILVEFLTCFCYCSATQSCQTLCDLIHSSTPGFPAL